MGYEGNIWSGIPTWTTQTRCIPTSIANSTHFPSLAVSASARRSSSSSDQVSLKGSGLAVFNLTTSHKSKSKRYEELAVDGGGQLSGSDVLLALQQADLIKKNKKKSSGGVNKGKKDSRLSGQNDDDELDESSSVKPLMIKSNWGNRIEQLETRLREISEI